MVEYGGSVPQVVVRQSTQPSASSYLFWIDTTDGSAYSSNGSSWTKISSSAEAQGWESAISQVILEILRLSAEGTLTAPDYDSMFVDYFSDADGQDGTVDTGNTTSGFSVDTYQNGTTSTESTNFVQNGAFAATVKLGVRFTTDNNCKLVSVKTTANCTATKAKLYAYTDGSALGSLLASASISSNEAVFDYDLVSGTKYYIVADSDGASYTDVNDNTPGYPIAQTNVTFDAGWSDTSGESSSYVWEIDSIKTLVRGTTLIQTNAQALSFAPAYILLHSKDNTVSGTGSLTFDVSFDGGSTWDSTGNAFDTKISVTDGSSKNMIIKINQNAGASSGQADLKDYEVILWSS